MDGVGVKKLKLIVASYFNELISVKWLVLSVLLYFYGSMIKKKIVENSILNNVNFNGWDISLSLVNDMYMIVYFVVPLVLFLSCITILDEFNLHKLIRLGSMKRGIIHSLKIFWLKFSKVLLIWIFISLFLTIGVPHSWGWSQFSYLVNPYNDLNEVAVIFSIPLIVFILQLFLFIYTISMLHVFLSLFYVTIKRKNYLLVMCVLLFIGGLVGFKLLPDEYAYLSPPTYFSLTKYVHSFNSLLKGIGILVVQTILLTLYLMMIDLHKKKYFLLLIVYLPQIIYISLFLLGISYSSDNLGTTEGTFLDVWLNSFSGTSSESFSYFSFFYYSIVFFGAVYLVNLDISKELDSLGFYKIIRFRNLEKWFWSWFKKILFKLFFLLVFSIIMSLLVGIITGKDIQFELTIANVSRYTAFYHFLVNGFLQIVVYVLLVFVISWTKKEASHGIILLSVFMVLMMPGVNQYGLIPVGLNSMVYLESIEPLSITIILFTTNFFIFFLIKYLFTKSIKK
jgi:hypothetical protein